MNQKSKIFLLVSGADANTAKLTRSVMNFLNKNFPYKYGKIGSVRNNNNVSNKILLYSSGHKNAKRAISCIVKNRDKFLHLKMFDGKFKISCGTIETTRKNLKQAKSYLKHALVQLLHEGKEFTENNADTGTQISTLRTDSPLKIITQNTEEAEAVSAYNAVPSCNLNRGKTVFLKSETIMR